ncbi:MAG: hypothetical protein QNK37_22715 [Acidobacteriota bacterium]|nr:hypothetical protein [Acidobacteriota bacterium]
MTKKSYTGHDPAYALDRFKHHLNDIIIEENLYPQLDTSEEAFDPEAALDLIHANNIHLQPFVDSVTWEGVERELEAYPNAGRAGSRRLVVAPCSPLFTDILERMADTYPNICFIDVSRADLTIGNHRIHHPDEITANPDDVCLMLTRNTGACESYRRKFGADNCINWLRAFNEKNQRLIAPETPAFLESIDAAEKSVVFASARPMATLNATIRKMNEDGYTTWWLGNEEIKEAHQTGYATPKVDDVPVTGYGIGSLIDFIHIFSNMKRGIVLWHYESIYLPAWDFKRIAVCYAATLAMIRTVKECRPKRSKAKLGLYMYDAVKPGVKNYEAGAACGRLYLKMVAEAEAIVFSSFTQSFGDFVENAVGKPLPRVHHHRYQVMPSRRRPRLTDGYHIAVLTAAMDEHQMPSMRGLVPYLRNLIVEQGIHIHYYMASVARGKSLQFKASLPEDRQALFHIHDPIHDLEALANEISRYHAGWSLFHMQAFSDMVANLPDQFMRDAMDWFTPTTLPSVVWSCAAAGLPIICNRSMEGVVDMLPPCMTIPLTLSELGNLRGILDRVDWETVDRTPLDDLDIGNQIHKLYRFLENML